jgi:hypothetical protein
MKQFICGLLLTTVLSIAGFGQSRYWVGVSGGAWSAVGNWSATSGGAGGAGAPTSVQDAIFDNGFSGTVSYDAGTITVNSLTVKSPANVTLSLPGSTGRTLTCNNGGSATPALDVESGATLTLTTTTNSATFTLTFAGVSNGRINGTFICAGAVSGGNGGRIDASSALGTGLLTVNGTYRMNIGSSNMLGLTSTLTFAAGSLFEVNKNGGTIPTATWNASSTINIIGSTSSAPTHLSSAAYGNIIYNCPGQSSNINFSMPTNMVVQGDLKILNTNGLTFRIATTINNVSVNDSLVIDGTNTTLSLGNNSTGLSKLTVAHFYQTGTNTTVNLEESSGDSKLAVLNHFTQSAGTITETGVGNRDTIEFSGTANQNITVSGSITQTVDIHIKNAAGVTLASDVTLPYRISMQDGNVTLGNFNLITPAINQVAAATTTNNHFATTGTGALTINTIGAGAVDFPVGHDASHLNTITLSNGNSLNWSVRVASGISPAGVAYPDRCVNRTWNIAPSAANPISPSPTIRFYFATADQNVNFVAANPCEIGDYTGSFWTVPDFNLMVAGTNPNLYVESSALQNFSPLVVGNLSSIVPLGNHISLSGRKAGKDIQLNWLADQVNNVRSFELQHNRGGAVFAPIGSVNATAERNYSFTHISPAAGTHFYRVKMLLSDGRSILSDVVAVQDGKIVQPALQGLWPNPVKDRATLQIAVPAAMKLELALTDARGRVLKQWALLLNEGNNSWPLLLEGLQPGTYYLFGMGAQGATNAVKVVKQ